MKKKEISLLLLVIFIGLVLRFYNLNNLPMEMYGDIVEGYKFTQEILTGKWPFYFVLGNGPLFFYFVAIIAKIFGLYFLTMKIASAIVGVGIIIITYCLGKELFGKETGLITAFLIAVSKWPLIFSRLGNMPILVPLFTSLIALFYLKALRFSKRRIFWLLAGFFSGLGLYIYPAFFIVPLALFVAFFLQGFKFCRKNFSNLIITLIFLLLTSLPFFRIFFDNPQGWIGSSSYFGSKIFLSDGKITQNWPYKFANNLKKTGLMFYREGDWSIRNNVAGQRAIDPISGVFLLVGILINFSKKKYRKTLFLLLVTIFILFLPSMLVLNASTDVPNMCRTLGAFPFVFIIIAAGIKEFAEILKKFLPAGLIIAPLLLIISLTNLSWYFNDYAYKQPNHNEGFPLLIAKEIDKLSSETQIYMAGGNWADFGQPDWRAVSFEIRTHKNFVHFEKEEFKCNLIPAKTSPVSFVLEPGCSTDLAKIQSCFPKGQIKNFYTPVYKFPLFTSYFLP